MQAANSISCPRDPEVQMPAAEKEESVTVPRLIRLPFVSETLTTARTTADLSLSLSSVSILACDTGAEYTWLILEPDGLRSGAWISSSFARGSEDGGAAPVKMLFRPLSLFLVALYRFA